MSLALMIGFIAGLVLIVYRGLYNGPWSAAFYAMGSCLGIAVAIYIILTILGQLGSFFIKLFLILTVGFLILLFGTTLWNLMNPDMPIVFPFISSLTNLF